MKKLLLTLLSVVATMSYSGAQTTETLSTEKFWPDLNQYNETKTSSSEFLGTTWNIKSLSNNNNTWTNIRCGNKNNAYTALIYNNTAIADVITKIVVNVTFVKTGANDKLNAGPKLYVSDNSEFPAASTSTFTLSSYSSAGDWTFEVPEDAIGSNKFYKLEFDCQKATNNGWLGINSLTFYKDAATITKCAQPTFTVENNATLYAEETVTINCATPDAAILYSVNGKESEGVAPVTISFDTDGVYVIDAIATKDGLEDSNPAQLSIEYIKDRPAGASTVTNELIVTNFSGNNNNNYADRTYQDITNGIKYAAQCAINNTNEFQIRSSNSNSGIIVTENIGGYKAKKIIIEWASSTTNGRILKFYGSDKSYAKPSELYANTAVEIGSLTYSSDNTTSEIEFSDATKQFAYIGMRSSSGAIYISKITIEWELPESTTGKEDAELSFGETASYTIPFGSEFNAPALVNPKNVAVNYSSENEAVATIENDGKVTISGIGTTTIKATPVDTEKYYGTASYTLTVQAAYSSIAEMLEKAGEGDKFIVNTPLTVGYANGANIYVTDNKGGYMLIYSYNSNLEALDVIPAGWTTEYTIYNGLPELKPVSLPAATEKGEYEIAEMVNPTDAEHSQIVVINEVVFDSATLANSSSNFKGTIDGEIWEFRNTHSIASVEAGKYRVTLIASAYQNKSTEIVAVNQLLPLSYEAYPTYPTIKIDEEDSEDDITISLNGKEKVVIELVHDDSENHAIFHKFVADATVENEPAAQADDDNDGFVEYSAPIEIKEAGTLHFYAQHKTTGLKSETRNITFTGKTTGIAEVEASAAPAEWFDLQGRRVAAPAKGVYVRRQGSAVSKVAL